MSDYTVTATLNVTTDADRAQVESLLNQGLKELGPIASRYGFTLRDSNVSVE